MSMPDWVASNPVTAEAFRHGRTQERLTGAVECLRRITAVCRDGKRPKADRLLEIEVDAADTLRRLSAATGGVIDDVEPVGGTA